MTLGSAVLLANSDNRRRSKSRVRLGIPARLELVTGFFPCMLENLSESEPG